MGFACRSQAASVSDGFCISQSSRVSLRWVFHITVKPRQSHMGFTYRSQAVSVSEGFSHHSQAEVSENRSRSSSNFVVVITVARVIDVIAVSTLGGGFCLHERGVGYRCDLPAQHLRLAPQQPPPSPSSLSFVVWTLVHCWYLVSRFLCTPTSC